MFNSSQLSCSACTIILFSVLLLNGCGGESAVELVNTGGTVLIDGEPAADIMVQVTPAVEVDVPAISSFGVTDAEGHFELTASDKRKGAMPGTSKVILVDMNEERPAQGEEQSTTSRIPNRYQILSPNSLSITVAEGQPIEIDVKSN